jgi:hypothetical protein
MQHTLTLDREAILFIFIILFIPSPLLSLLYRGGKTDVRWG